MKKILLLIMLLLSFASATAQTDEIRNERVHFRQGANSAVIKGKITGYEVVDYLLGARKGQHMNVSMTSSGTIAYFNILAPGENGIAFSNGSINDNRFEAVLPESGDYTIRVYQMRNSARRNEVASYRLELIVTNP